jgi:2-polyprenyl-3-methyl-5-hydroxy-6-metoxy-1,4-benzoquinol methylase
MKIQYYLYDVAWERYNAHLKDLVSKPDIKTVCDIGGGANPLLSLEEVERYKLDYTLLDISSEQLDKASNGYKKIQADITDPNLLLDEKYDLVCSKLLAEHVSSGLIFYQNTFKLLNNDGYAFHFFPTLYNLPFLINILLPETISDPILLFFQPSRIREGKNGKFKAYYDWCFGPTKKNIERITSLGFNIEEYIGFFGHAYYKKLSVLNALEKIKSQLLLKYPSPYLTQFAQVLLKKGSK